MAKVKAQEAEAKEIHTVEALAWRWFAEVAEPANSTPRNFKCVLEKDVLPAIGAKQIVDVTVDDVLQITDRDMALSSDEIGRLLRSIDQSPSISGDTRLACRHAADRCRVFNGEFQLRARR